MMVKIVINACVRRMLAYRTISDLINQFLQSPPLLCLPKHIDVESILHAAKVICQSHGYFGYSYSTDQLQIPNLRDSNELVLICGLRLYPTTLHPTRVWCRRLQTPCRCDTTRSVSILVSSP